VIPKCWILTGIVRRPGLPVWRFHISRSSL
jgi:hypothetical protein